MPDSIWVITPATSPPDASEPWSFSKLLQFRTCPRMWWLRYSRYPNIASSRYPDRCHPAAIHGRVVHSLMDSFFDYVAESGIEDISTKTVGRLFREFSPKKRVTSVIQEEIESESQSNARFNSALAIQKVSAQDCLNDFKRLARLVPCTAFSNTSGAMSKNVGHQNAPKQGAEITLRSARLGLFGVLDAIANGEVLDFKTGKRDEKHKDQLRFYALLYRENFGRMPERLTLMYNDGGESSSWSPQADELETCEQEVINDIERARKYVALGSAPSEPTIENCEHCPVRQLCDDYWESTTTKSLRTLPDDPDGPPLRSCRLDVKATIALQDFLKTKSGEPMQMISSELGRITAQPSNYPLAEYIEDSNIEVRFVNALARRNSERWSVSCAKGGEAFWLVN